MTSLSGLTPNIEAVLRYNPSLVVASQNSGGLVSGLGKLGIPVLIEPAATTLSGVYRQIEQIGQATGHYNQAAEVVTNMQEVISDTVAQVGTRYRGMTYYWEMSGDPYYAATSATLIGHILDMFGLKNIADAAGKPADGGYPELSGGTSSPPGRSSSSCRTTSPPTAGRPRRWSPGGRAGRSYRPCRTTTSSA